MVALLAAVGCYALLSIKAFNRGRSELWRDLLLVAFCALPVHLLAVNFQKNGQEKQMVRYDYGTNLLKSLPYESVFFAEGDEDYFPLYYLQNVEHKRPDVRLIPAFILFEPWGVAQIERLYPSLGLTASGVSFPDHFARIIYSSSEIVVKNRGNSPIAFSYFNGAFHRYYLSRHPSLLFRKSGVILGFGTLITSKGPWLGSSQLRIRHSLDCPSNAHPALHGIWAAYQTAGIIPY
jgi:hypothetical protein